MGRVPPDRQKNLTPRPKAKRPVGRPTTKDRPIGPAERAAIAELYLQHWPMVKIAERFGVDISTIHHHLNTHIKPEWNKRLHQLLSEQLAKVDLMEKHAWEKFFESCTDKIEEVLEKHGPRKTKGSKKPAEVVKQVLKRVKQVGDKGWLEVIQWCIDFRAKVAGWNAPHRVSVSQTVDVRVAGKSRNEIDSELTTRIAYLLESREKRVGVLEAAGVELPKSRPGGELPPGMPRIPGLPVGLPGMN